MSIAAAVEAEKGFPLEPHLVVLALMGSHGRGTYLPPEEPTTVDDVDPWGSSRNPNIMGLSWLRDQEYV